MLTESRDSSHQSRFAALSQLMLSRCAPIVMRQRKQFVVAVENWLWSIMIVITSVCRLLCLLSQLMLSRCTANNAAKGSNKNPKSYNEWLGRSVEVLFSDPLLRYFVLLLLCLFFSSIFSNLSSTLFGFR